MLRGGLSMLLAQNLILMGIFFTVPLFLQVVQGLDALETGVRMLPASVGSVRRRARRLGAVAPLRRRGHRPRSGSRSSLRVDAAAPRHDRPDARHGVFLVAMGVLGIGMGLVVSQLGNVAQSAVGRRPKRGGRPPEHRRRSSAPRSARRCSARSSSAGSITAFSSEHGRRPRDLRRGQGAGRGPTLRRRVVRLLRPGPGDRGRAGVDPEDDGRCVEDYEDAQLNALKTAFLFASLIVLASFWATRRLPAERFDQIEAARAPPAATADA